jgi:hypothetical protein
MTSDVKFAITRRDRACLSYPSCSLSMIHQTTAPKQASDMCDIWWRVGVEDRKRVVSDWLSEEARSRAKQQKMQPS